MTFAIKNVFKIIGIIYIFRKSQVL